MRRFSFAVLGLTAICGVVAGPEAWGKLIWRAGFPGSALPLIENAAARGAVLYQLGRSDMADAAFEAVGRSATYDRGLTLAATGKYSLSVAYFNAVLFANRYDAGARQNRALVASLVDPVIAKGMGHGRIQAVLAEAGLETEAFDPENPPCRFCLRNATLSETASAP